MNEKFFQQLINELIEANGQALGLLAAAMARQMDADKLTADLRAQLEAAKAAKLANPTAIRIATHALAAAEAETALRKRANH